MINKKVLAMCLSPDRGGLELYFLKFVDYYIQRDTEVHVACSKKSYITNNISKNKLECRSHGFFNNLINFLIIRRYIVKNKIDLIHVSWSKDLFLAALLKTFSPRDVKIIFYRQMKIPRSKKDLIHRIIYKKIDLFLVITKKLYQEACAFLPIDKSRVHILPYGIKRPLKNNKITKQKFFSKYNMNTSIFSVGIFSRIEEQKGQHLVLDAIKQSRHDIQLFIIGHCMDNNYRKSLIESTSKYNLTNFVRFIEFVDSPMSFMPFFDLIILPTYEETFGLTVAEAMLMQVPVIGSNVGGVPEIINHGHNGLLFKTKNHHDLQEKIDSIIEKKEMRQKFVDNGVKFINEKYDYNSHYIHFEKIISRYQ